MDSGPHSAEVRPATPVALASYLQPITPFLTADTTDLCINKPGEVWVESSRGWNRHQVPELTLKHLMNLAITSANAAGGKISSQNPILSAALPSGERIQVVMPPAVPKDTYSFTIRKPSEVRFSLSDYEKAGFFRSVRVGRSGLLDHETELKALLEAREIARFFELAVSTRQTILVSGGTGSGKTTFMKALVDMIPSSERLVTIEDTSELDIRHQPNHVRLFYTKGNALGQAQVSARDCLEACMRMKPDRIMQAEIRDSAAFHFISGSNSGHPGSITSIHANSEREAFGRLAFLMGGDDEARSMTRTDIMDLITSTVDVVVQVGRAEGIRAATGIYYDPDRKLARMG